MANRVRTERLEIKLTKEEKEFFSSKNETSEMQKHEPFFEKVRYWKKKSIL